MKSIFIADEKAMLDFGAELATQSKPGDIIFLEGQLGVGKTTIVRGFLRAIGYEEKVKSPTYSLVETYFIEGREIIHFDLYRLENAQELLDIGLEDYLSSHALFLIEWAEKARKVLPKPTLVCKIAINADQLSRSISIVKHDHQKTN